MQVVVVPTLRLFFNRVLLTAPSNKPARGFDPSAKTMHSVIGMKPQDSMRTSSLHIKSDNMRKRMDANQTHAGAWVHDEVLQTSAPLLHAAALRTTYARQQTYSLDTARYAQPNEIMGRMSFLAFCGDHLQLPPVPKSSGLLAPLDNTSDEHKAGAQCLKNMHYLFEMETMKRFTDPTLIAILQKMRKRGGAKLTDQQWQALFATEVDASQLDEDPQAFLLDTADWFESCYLWSVVSMACYSRAMSSARQHQQTLFFCQAVDFSEQIARHRRDDLEVYKRMLSVPSVAHTGRLPAMVLLHMSMRVRLTTQILPPWAVQDATGTIMEIDFSPRDRRRICDSGDAPPATPSSKDKKTMFFDIGADSPGAPGDVDMEDEEATLADGPSGSSDRRVLSPDRRPPAMNDDLILADGPGAGNERRVRTLSRGAPTKRRALTGDMFTHADEPATKKSIIDDPEDAFQMGVLAFAAQRGSKPGVISGQSGGKDQVFAAQRGTMPGVDWGVVSVGSCSSGGKIVSVSYVLWLHIALCLLIE